MGMLASKTIEMTTMAVLNHTEEELDDDIVSNLSLNLMVSDNEDGGSPTSDRFDKVDSRNESPEDSNNCDNSEEAKMTCDDIPNNEMKDDLQQLRDITGDSSWSAVDDSDSCDFSIDIDNAISTKTENKESTSSDTEPTIKEDNTKITMDEDKLEAIEENRDPSGEEEEAIAKKNTEEDSEENLANQNFTKEPEEKDEEMENEERLLNDVKDNEKEAEDCEHLDEDALLSDPRDEDLLQITEEKSAENDTADFLRCCQEEQEANENSCSSTEKGEDNHSESAGEYEESNTDAFESDDTVTNDNYENGDIDNDSSGYDLNLVKCEDTDDAQGGSNGEPDIVDEEMTDANVTENKGSSTISENNISVPETNSMEYFNGDADNLVTSENNPDETEEYTEACEEETRVESSDNIEQSTDAEQLDDRQEEYEKGQSTESHLDKDTSTMENMSHRSEPVLSGIEASTKKITITEVKSCGDEGSAEESTDMAEATDDNFETTEETAEECNNILESSERTITEECNNIEATTDTADAPRQEENEMLSSTVKESIKSETVSCNNNTLCESEVTNENDALPDIVKERELFLPLESTTKEDVRMEGDESEKHMQTENDIATGNQVEKNDAVLNITNDTDELPTEDFTTDNDELSTEGITIAKKELAVVEDIPIAKGDLTVEDTTIANEDLIVEDITNTATEDLVVEDITNAKQDLIVEDITNAKEVAVKNINPVKNEEIEADCMAAISEDANKPKETDDEPMEVDDMDLDALSIQSCIDDNAPCITNIPVVKDLIDNTSERTNEPNTITIHDQIDLEGKTDTNTYKKEDKSKTNLELILDNTKPKTLTTNNVLDENIINLIDDCEPEVIADSAQQTDAIKLQNLAADSIVTKHTIDTAQLQNFTNALNIVKPPSGIEGDNKECEDMDIEVITPYKESVTRPNGSVLKQILVTKNIPSTLSSTSPIISLPTTDGKQNTKTYFIVSPISNTIADNNIAVVSPQPGEKRLSSDNFQTENAKRRRLAAPGVKETRHKYLEQFKQAMATTNWSRIGRRQLEEFATQKLLEAMHYKTGMGELHKKCTEYKQSLENLRTNSLTLTKQLRDMNSVHIKLEREINILKARHRNDDKPLVAVKITRSVGLQAMVEDPKTNRRPRSNNVGGSARTSAQKQPLQVAQQQQQIHPPQLQQKPMSQQPPVQVQVPQRVVVGTGNSPQLQPRPAPRPLVSHPSVATPVQTRTMSRNKKVQLPTIVNSVNPPPLRSINQQQSTAITTIPTNSTTIGIPIKHITGPTILNKIVGVPIQTVATPIVTTTEVSKGVIDLTDEDDVGKKLSPMKNTSAPQQQQQQQQRITLMSTVVNGQQVLLRVDGGGPIPSKAATALTNGTPLFVQSPMMQQRVSASNAIKMVAGVPLRTRTSSAVQTPPQQTNNVPPPPNTAASRRFRHPAPLPAPPSSQTMIKGNKPIPPKPTVTVNKSPNGSGIIVKWNMPSMLSLFEKIVRYELFVYQVTKSPPRTDSWGKINDVGALDLPMAVSLTEFAEGNRYYFAVRAVDELGRLGPFSEPQTIVF